MFEAVANTLILVMVVVWLIVGVEMFRTIKQLNAKLAKIDRFFGDDDDEPWRESLKPE